MRRRVGFAAIFFVVPEDAGRRFVADKETTSPLRGAIALAGCEEFLRVNDCAEAGLLAEHGDELQGLRAQSGGRRPSTVREATVGPLLGTRPVSAAAIVMSS